MYRAVTFYLLKNKIDYYNQSALKEAFGCIQIFFKNIDDQNITYLNGENVEMAIRSPEVADHVSEVAAISLVRLFLRAQQQSLGKQKGLVMDGRDIGSVIFPNAEVKFFITSSVEIRAKRRFQELIEKGVAVTLEEVKTNLKKRDHIDTNRAHSPLTQVEDAILIDNSHMSREEQLQLALEHIEKKMASLS